MRQGPPERDPTSLRTIVDCCRRLPFDEALALVDSALRSGRVTRHDLGSIEVQGAGAALYDGCSRTPTAGQPTRSSPCSWRVLRFAWEQVMHDQAYVRWALAEFLGPHERDELAGPLSLPA